MSAASNQATARDAEPLQPQGDSEDSQALRHLERLARQRLPRRKTFDRSVKVQTFEPGDVIFESNEKFPHLFALLKGGVKTRVSIHGTGG